MKVFDCFLYLNEDAVLEVRLNELDSMVDYFVIVEATTTHSGKPKATNFDIDKPQFNKFKDKIIYILVTDLKPNPTNTSIVDGYQRDYISKALVNAEDDDIIMLSDLDEIPMASILKALFSDMDDRNYRCIIDKHVFYFNSVSLGTWEHGTLITRYKNFRQHLPSRWKANTGLPEVRIENAGWHFCYFGGREGIINKMGSYTHTELNNEQGRKFFLDGLETEPVIEVMDEHYPQYVRDNVSKFLTHMKGIK